MKKFPGRGVSLQAASRSKPLALPTKIQKVQPEPKPDYQLKDGKVAIANQAKNPKNINMPGVGKVLGSLGSKDAKSHNVTVIRSGGVVNNNVAQTSKPNMLIDKNPEKWRCKVCTFANFTYVEDEKTGQKTLVDVCQKCKSKKEVLKEANINSN